MTPAGRDHLRPVADRAEVVPARAATCRVWWADPSTVTATDVALLDRAERRRLGDARRPDNRAHFLCGAVLLRRVVAAECGTEPDRVVVDRTCDGCGYPHGRPRLTGLDRYASVAHSGDRVGVAVTAAGPVGLDVERMVPRDIGRFAPRVLADGEEATGAADFYRYWTRKESVVKATGAGITVGLRRVKVSAPHEPPRLLAYPGMADPVAGMRDLCPGSGYAAAVTILGAEWCPVDERWAHWRDVVN